MLQTPEKVHLMCFERRKVLTFGLSNAGK